MREPSTPLQREVDVRHARLMSERTARAISQRGADRAALESHAKRVAERRKREDEELEKQR